MKKILILAGLFFITSTAITFAAGAPSSVFRDTTGFIRPLILTDSIKALFFTATSTTQASTFPYASTTNTSATTLCLTGDSCRTTWPIGVATSTNPLMATYFVATSTTIASQFPYASTTAFSFTSTSTGTSGINITGGCFAFGGVCINGGGTIGPGTTGQVAYYNGTNTAVGTSTITIGTNSFVGIASTSPGSLLSIGGGNITQTAGSPTIIGNAAQTNVGRGLAVRGKYAYVIENTAASALEVFDVNNPYAPVLVSTLALSLGGSSYPVIAGNYLFVALTGTTNPLQIIDISNPTAPVLVNAITPPGAGSGRSLNISGRYLYYGDGSGRFIIYDISNPISPQLMSATTLTNVGAIWSVSLQGNYAYVGEATTTAATAGLHIIDVSNPVIPTVVATYATRNSVRATEIMGRYLYLGEATPGDLEIVDVKNPASPTQVGTFATAAPIGTAAQSMMPVLGNYLYYPGNTLMQVIDISNPATPFSAGTVNTSSGANAEGMVPNGKYMYVATAASGASGFEVADLSGALLPSASIGSLSTSYLTVNGRSSFANTILAQGGLEVGNLGILSHGGLGVFIGSTTQQDPVAAVFSGGSVQVANSLLIGTTSTTTAQSALRLSSLTSIFGQVLSGIAQTFNFAFASSTNSDSSGANAFIDASNGVGGGVSGDLIFRTASSTSSTIVTLDATSTRNAGTATVTSTTWSHTIGAACANPVLIISLSPSAARTYAASTTLSGNFTKIASTTNGTSAMIVMSITNPTVGAQTISVTQTDGLSGQRLAATSVSYCNVNQTTPYGNIQTSGTSSGTSVSLTSYGGGQMIFDALGKTDNTENPVANAGQLNIAATSTNQATPSNNRQASNSQILARGANVTTGWSWATARAASYIQIPINSTSGTTANTLTDRLHITFAGNVGIGTDVPTAVNANARLTVAGTGSQDIIASTTDNTTSSAAILEAYSDSARTFMGSHGSNQTTSRFGITLGGWSEFATMNSSASTTNGLILGVIANKPLVFGTNSLERGRFDSGGFFGLGTTTPWGLLSLKGATGVGSPLLVIASSTNTTAFMVTAAGHIIASSTSPVLSSCGTSPSMLGSDSWGTVTTGATAGGCTVTFQQAWAAAPTCTVTPRTGSVVNTFSYTVSASALTVTETALGGGLFDYRCTGNSGAQ